jgi:preprotein translocase subunit SecE
LWVRFLPGLPDDANAVSKGGVLPVTEEWKFWSFQKENSVAKEVKPVAKNAKPAAKETSPAPKSAKEEKSVVRSGKPNFFQRSVESVKRYFNETVGELRRVSWPTRREAWYLTVTVLIVTGIMAAILGTFDYIFSKIFEWILTLPL